MELNGTNLTWEVSKTPSQIARLKSHNWPNFFHPATLDTLEGQSSQVSWANPPRSR